MITLSTREIIRSAKFIAGIRNSNLSNFEYTTSILNNIYRQLYQEIIDNSDSYISILESDVSIDGIQLPPDCYQIEAVYKGESWEYKVELQRSSRNEDIPGCWRIINNRLYIDGSNSGHIFVKYSTMPPTLTAPDDPKKLNLSMSPNYETALDDKYFYYINSDGATPATFKYFKYDLENDTETEITFEQFPSNPYNEFIWNSQTYTVDYTEQKIYDENGEDVTSMFVFRTDERFEIIRADDPHWVVTYEDHTIYIDGVEWNIMADTGHKTKGVALALSTNDRTGKGLIWAVGNNIDEAKFYYCSFVPDTVLSYPDNSFFQLLEYKFAQYLNGQTGTANTVLEETLLPDAEKQFYTSLSKSGNIVRTNNIYNNRII